MLGPLIISFTRKWSPRHALPVSVLGLGLILQPAFAQEWSRFRGPNGTGHGHATAIPTQWSEADYNWRIRLPGGGHASPILWGNRIFLTGADETRFFVFAVDGQDGEVLWRREYPHGEYNLHRFSSFASATCAADEARVYFTRQDGGRLFLCALTHEGRPVWELPLGQFESEHGSGHSPMVYGDLLILAFDQDLPGRLLAVDRATGRERWSVARQAGKADYSVPSVYEQPGQRPVLLFNSLEDGIAGVDPDTGRIRWRTDDRVLRMRSISSPIEAAGLIFASCGSGGGGHYLIAVRPPPNGSGRAEVAYDIRQSAPYVPTPVAHEGRVFLWSDGGIVTCIDPANGKVHWQERVGGNFFSSPVCIDGRLYGTSDTGEVVVLAAAGEFRLLARNRLGELSRATPAVANGNIYFRTWEHLISLGGSERAAAN